MTVKYIPGLVVSRAELKNNNAIASANNTHQYFDVYD